ncbi:glycosyltransferase family 9 protein [Sphingomonas crusticola]|uniref:glycosyltransferase family 9 protein n=1 Tax=Sphingomonas crusticola TaxID=1697973 RepID=UPI000E240C02|nr:glycosyltransferase family 9 protein [Sphingomonas crusticola]
MSAIVVSPFSNSDIRDWQPGHFSALIGLLLDRWDGLIRVIGTRSQATRAAAIVRPYDATRVISLCGHLAWDDVVAEVREAACVIGNNSGVTHLAGWLDVPTVCVFGGSHQRIEWRPVGFSARTVSRAIGCAPCHLHYASDCPYGKACLGQIEPEEVAEAVFSAMDQRTGQEARHGA